MNQAIKNRSSFGILLATLFVTGCGGPELTLSSVTAVDYYDQTELPLPGSAESFSGIVGGRSLVRGASSQRPHELLLLAHAASQTDFSRVSYSRTLGIKAYICDQPKVPVLLDLPYIFSAGQDVRLGPVQRSRDEENLSSPYSYSIYFRVAREGNLANTFPEEGFDLKKEPFDVCFSLVGGDYRALGYSSNTVKISKETIASAIHTYKTER